MGNTIKTIIFVDEPVPSHTRDTGIGVVTMRVCNILQKLADDRVVRKKVLVPFRNYRVALGDLHY